MGKDFKEHAYAPVQHVLPAIATRIVGKGYVIKSNTSAVVPVQDP